MFIKTVQNMLNTLILVNATGGDEAVDPLYTAISTIGPYAMGVVLMLGVIYGIIMGVKFAKAEKSEERAAIQKALINGAIGFIAIFALLVILYAIRKPLVNFMNS